MKYERCGNRDCGQLVQQPKVGRKMYCNSACKQAAYRQRQKVKTRYSKITYERWCVNCGKKYTTTIARQQFHNTSCRVSFHQQLKRMGRETK
jgi:hypothetical protein